MFTNPKMILLSNKKRYTIPNQAKYSACFKTPCCPRIHLRDGTLLTGPYGKTKILLTLPKQPFLLHYQPIPF